MAKLPHGASRKLFSYQTDGVSGMNGITTIQRSLFLAGTIVAFCASVGCGQVAVVPEAAMFTGETGGCGDFSVYRFNRRRTLAIHLSVKEDDFNIGKKGTETECDIDLEKVPAGVKLKVVQFAAPAKEYFCDDVFGDPEPFVKWIAVAGKVHVECDRRAPQKGNATHRVSVILKDIKIKNEKDGTFTTLPRVEIKDVSVGWLPG
jgi:hypothetical protein